MLESELLGTLLPTHPDLFPIVEKIREKYLIPEVSPDHDELTEILLANDIDWQAVRRDIEREVKANEDLLPASIKKIYDESKKLDNTDFNFPELEPLSEETRQQVIIALKYLYHLLSLSIPSLDEFYTTISDRLFEYLLTGKTREAPQDWFSKVFTLPSFESPIVVAMAGPLADPKAIAEQFKAEYTKTFGKDRPKITKTHLKTAEYLSMKLEGKSLNDMVDLYIDRHPSEFPKNKKSPEYRKAFQTCRGTIKKNIQRLQDAIDERVGDKK